MKILKSMWLGLLMVAGCAEPGLAQIAPTNINPAFFYYQSFIDAPKPMSEADWDYLGSRESGTQKLPDRFGGFVAAYDSQFKLLQKAARSATPCDWGIDKSEGPGTLLPHLARAKAAAMAVPMRVTWHLEHGCPDAARDDILSTLVLGRNTSQDGTLISTLVQFAIEAIDYSALAENFGQFSPETLQQIVKGLDAAPARRTAASCMATEKTMFFDWFLRWISELQHANPGDDQKVMTAIHDTLFPPEDNQDNKDAWEQVLKSSGGTSQGVVKLLKESAVYFPRLARTLALPHDEYEPQMEQLKTEIDQSSNPIIKTILGSFYKVRPREFRVEIYEAMVRAAVEYRLHGEAGLKTVADPCGNGPFAFRRFAFEGVDRGFELKSAYLRDGKPEVMIFAEKPGPKFFVDGTHPGESRPSLKEKK